MTRPVTLFTGQWADPPACRAGDEECCPAFGINFDPSHLHHQFVDPVLFLETFADRIYHVHVKENVRHLDGRTSILSSHLNFGDARRGWDFVSAGLVV
jgi:sugar phosphate isomerase/epimerase